MILWRQWLFLVNQLEEAFSRKKTFLWFVMILIGFTIKFDAIGVTSLVQTFFSSAPPFDIYFKKYWRYFLNMEIRF